MRATPLMAFFWSFILVAGVGIEAASLKKVILLDFKNVLKKRQFNYLEPSITNAIREKLKKRFAYHELAKEQWQEAARGNFISEDDLYTYSAAMNLGLLLRQDIVIFGGYVIEDKRQSAFPEIKTRVRILDLAKRKEITDFETQNNIDSTFFAAINAIADRIVTEATPILPNISDWSRGTVTEEIPSFNQLSLRAQIAPVAFSASRVFSSTSQFAGTDFRQTAGLAMDFHHFGILKEQLGLFVAGMARVSSDRFSYNIDNSAVPAALQSFAGQAGFAWRQKLSSKFYLQPFLAGGLQYDIMKFTHENRTIAVTSVEGQNLNSTEYTLRSPFASVGLRLGYAISSWLFLEGGGQYALFFYEGDNGQSVFAEIGVGVRL